MSHISSKIKVLLGPSTFAESDKTPLEFLKKNGIEVIPNPHRRKLAKNELLELLGNDVVGLIAGLEILDKEVFDRSRLKVVSRCGSGMSNIDIETAQKKGIRVYSTPNGPTAAVAELTVGALLSLLREIPRMDAALHHKKWDKRLGFQLAGKILAIIGYGRIGRKVAELARAFRATVLAVDPLYRGEDSGVQTATLDEALRQADIFSLHSSGTQEIIGRAEIARMKKGAFLLNASRGELINEAALADALKEGKVAGAWLDTFTQEPYKGPLCDLPQVILTPHVGSYTVECRRSMEMEAAENVVRGLKETSL